MISALREGSLGYLAPMLERSRKLSRAISGQLAYQVGESGLRRGQSPVDGMNRCEELRLHVCRLVSLSGFLLGLGGLNYHVGGPKHQKFKSTPPIGYFRCHRTSSNNTTS